VQKFSRFSDVLSLDSLLLTAGTVATDYLLKRSVRKFQYSRINIDLLQTLKHE